MPRTAGLSRKRKKKKKPAPTSGAFSLKLLPAAGAGRIRARGPRALKLGRRQRPPPVRPGWATWGRGDVPASRRPPPRRAGTRGHAGPSISPAPRAARPDARAGAWPPPAGAANHASHERGPARGGASCHLSPSGPSAGPWVGASTAAPPPPGPHPESECRRAAPQTQPVLADLSLRTHRPAGDVQRRRRDSPPPQCQPSAGSQRRGLSPSALRGATPHARGPERGLTGAGHAGG